VGIGSLPEKKDKAVLSFLLQMAYLCQPALIKDVA
jgi:hypothetical protein